MAGRTVQEEYEYAQISTDTLLKTGQGMLAGVFCSSVSGAGTVTVYDNTSASGSKIVDTFTATAGRAYPMPCKFYTGLYVAVSGASLTTYYQ